MQKNLKYIWIIAGLTFGILSSAQAQVLDTLPNRIGLQHLQSFYDNGQDPSFISGVEYMRRLKNKSTLIGRVNYAHRTAGDGWQGELETYWTHSPKYYSYASVSFSKGLVFPQWKAGYSLFRNFNKGWEADLGYRFLRAEDINMHSLSWGVGKYVGNYWINLHGYLIRDADKTHQSYRLSARYYLNDQLDYVTAMLFTGTSPDDRSRNFNYNSFSSFISKGFGLGYKKSFGSKYQGLIIGSYNNQKIADNAYLNQVDISVSLYRNF